mgnify:FL=1
MLSEEMISRLVLEIKRFLLADAMLLSRASDEQLMRRIADVADHKLGKVSLSPQERSRVVRLVFSSIRGLGILDEILADGRIGEITKWLNEKIHWYGSTRTPKEVIAAVCGKEVSAQPLVRYMKKKYTRLYGLSEEA